MRGLVGAMELFGADILVHDNGGRLVGHLYGTESLHSLDKEVIAGAVS